MKVYLAGPLFSISERTHNLRLARELTKLGYEVLLPQVEALKYLPDLLAICKDCKGKAMTSDIVVASIDGSDADSGTAMEVGLALASFYRPVVICVRTDFRTSLKDEVGINGMLQLVDRLIYKPSFVTALKESEDFYEELALEIHKAIKDVIEVH